MEDLKGKIRVYVRVRPFSTKEKNRGCTEAVTSQGKTTIAVQDPRVKEEKTFDFDQVPNMFVQVTIDFIMFAGVWLLFKHNGHWDSWDERPTSFIAELVHSQY